MLPPVAISEQMGISVVATATVVVRLIADYIHRYIDTYIDTYIHGTVAESVECRLKCRSSVPGRVKPMTYKIDFCHFLARRSALIGYNLQQGLVSCVRII